MLQNAYFLSKLGADTAENEQHFAEILPIGRRVAELQPLLQPEREPTSGTCGDRPATWGLGDRPPPVQKLLSEKIGWSAEVDNVVCR